MSRPTAAVLASTLALLALPDAASARSERTLGYRLAEVWPTTVRFLRVDRRYPITDRDKEAGFILFVYPGTGAVKKCRGALEMVPVRGERGERLLRIQLTIDHQPSYVEVDLLERLERKLRSEHGPPREDRADPPRRAPHRGAVGVHEDDRRQGEGAPDRTGEHAGGAAHVEQTVALLEVEPLQDHVPKARTEAEETAEGIVEGQQRREAGGRTQAVAQRPRAAAVSHLPPPPAAGSG